MWRSLKALTWAFSSSITRPWVSIRCRISDSTVWSYIKAIEREPEAGAESQGRPAETPSITLRAILTPDNLLRLKALLKWWHQREKHAQQPPEPPRDLIRWTVYIGPAP
jgi:hypothetical protein